MAQVNAAIATAVSAPDIRDMLAKQYFEPWTSSPDEFAEFIHKAIVEKVRLARAIGSKPE